MVGLSSDSDLLYVYAYNIVLFRGGFFDRKKLMYIMIDKSKYDSHGVFTYESMIYNIKYNLYQKCI
jgi:hypothetical protein